MEARPSSIKGRAKHSIISLAFLNSLYCFEVVAVVDVVSTNGFDNDNLSISPPSPLVLTSP